MSDGRIEEYGTFTELTEADKVFAEFAIIWKWTRIKTLLLLTSGDAVQ